MKSLIWTSVLIVFSLPCLAQEARVITDKDEYKFDEIIKLTFEINANTDSAHISKFEDFKLVSGPNTTKSISVKNGEQTVSERRSLELRAFMGGGLIINSPTYIIDGKSVKGESKKINIAPSNLTEKEIQETNYVNFIEDKIKPEGALRVVIHDNMGYLEIQDGLTWKFHRRITNKEIEQHKSLK